MGIKDKKEYIGNCTHINFNKYGGVAEVIDNSKEINLKEFLKNCNVGNMEFYQSEFILVDMIIYDNDFKYFINTELDIYYFIHSGIEYFFGSCDNE